MRSITTLALIGLAAVVATGCAVPEQYKAEREMKQLDANTYELSLREPWVENEINVREDAMKEATQFCGEKNQGMQPLQAISRSARETGNGAFVRYTFRCVGYLDAPKTEYHRFGFYSERIEERSHGTLSRRIRLLNKLSFKSKMPSAREGIFA